MTETGWLVETKAGPMWWTGTCWTADSTRALRFARQCDAEYFIKIRDLQVECYATEHAWHDVDLDAPAVEEVEVPAPRPLTVEEMRGEFLDPQPLPALRDEALWQEYERARARVVELERQVLASAVEEPWTDDERRLGSEHARVLQEILDSDGDHDLSRRLDQIEDEARGDRKQLRREEEEVTQPAQPAQPEKPVYTDIKEALSSGRKADTTHVRRAFQIYTARPCEYGDKRQGGKYIRGNYRRPTGGAHHAEPTADDFRRFQAYLRAARDHIDETLDSMEMHLATDPDLLDVEGFKRAAYAVDTDTKPGDVVGPSLLPHVAPACASLNMAITQATDCGLLPRDPGQPWRDPTAREWLVGPSYTVKEISVKVTSILDAWQKQDNAVGAESSPIEDLDAEIEFGFQNDHPSVG